MDIAEDKLWQLQCVLVRVPAGILQNGAHYLCAESPDCLMITAGQENDVVVL